LNTNSCHAIDLEVRNGQDRGKGGGRMPSFLDCRIDSDAILADIEAIARIESPTSDVGGVNRVLDVIAGWFAGSGAVIERFKTDDDRFGDMLRVTCNPGRNEPASWC
jgi:hypothetical protein